MSTSGNPPVPTNTLETIMLVGGESLSVKLDVRRIGGDDRMKDNRMDVDSDDEKPSSMKDAETESDDDDDDIEEDYDDDDVYKDGDLFRSSNMFKIKRLSGEEAKKLMKDIPKFVNAQWLKDEFKRLVDLRDEVVDGTARLDNLHSLLNYIVNKEKSGKQLSRKSKNLLAGLYQTNADKDTSDQTDQTYRLTCNLIFDSLDKGRVWIPPKKGWNEEINTTTQRVTMKYLVENSFDFSTWLTLEHRSDAEIARTIGYTVAVVIQAILFCKLVDDDPFLQDTLRSLPAEATSLLFAGYYVKSKTRVHIPDTAEVRKLDGKLITSKELSHNVSTGLRHRHWRITSGVSAYVRLTNEDAAAHFIHKRNFDDDVANAWLRDPSNPSIKMQERSSHKKLEQSDKLNYSSGVVATCVRGGSPPTHTPTGLLYINANTVYKRKVYPTWSDCLPSKLTKRAKKKSSETSVSKRSTEQKSNDTATVELISVESTTDGEVSDPVVFEVTDVRSSFGDYMLHENFVKLMIERRRFVEFEMDDVTVECLWRYLDPHHIKRFAHPLKVFRKSDLITEERLQLACQRSSLMARVGDPGSANTILIREGDEEGVLKTYYRSYRSHSNQILNFAQNYVVVTVPTGTSAHNFVKAHQARKLMSALFVEEENQQDISDDFARVIFAGYGLFLSYADAEAKNLIDLPDLALAFELCQDGSKELFIFSFLEEEYRKKLPSFPVVMLPVTTRAFEQAPKLKFEAKRDFVRHYFDGHDDDITFCSRELDDIEMCANDFYRAYFNKVLSYPDDVVRKKPLRLYETANEFGLQLHDLLYKDVAV